jgi:hypothetical protein
MMVLNFFILNLKYIFNGNSIQFTEIFSYFICYSLDFPKVVHFKHEKFLRKELVISITGILKTGKAKKQGHKWGTKF